jgi:hypothetical protein
MTGCNSAVNRDDALTPLPVDAGGAPDRGDTALLRLSGAAPGRTDAGVDGCTPVRWTLGVAGQRETHEAWRGAASGGLAGRILTLSIVLADMLVTPPAYDGDKDPLPNFRAAEFQWQLLYFAVALLGSAVLGGAIGAVSGRLGLAIARRGVPVRRLVVGFAVVSACLGLSFSLPRRVTMLDVGATVVVIVVGAACGVLAASSIFRRRPTSAAGAT